jgi:hypothetical protein
MRGVHIPPRRLLERHKEDGAGNVYARSVPTPSGGVRLQYLPGYKKYAYTAPTEFPVIKDSQGRSWILSQTEAIMNSGLQSAELDQMVKLGINKLTADFKQVYDPATRVNYESGSAMLLGGNGLTALLSGNIAAAGDAIMSNANAIGQNMIDSASGTACAGLDGEDCLAQSINSNYVV